MIQYDNSLLEGGTVSSGHLTFSYTVGSGVDKILFVTVCNPTNSTDIFTGITYNGVAMTRLTGTAGTNAKSDLFQAIYYLINPSTGANTVDVSASQNVVIRVGVTSYSGVSQTAPTICTINATAINVDTNTTSLTTTSSDSFIYSFVSNNFVANVASTGVTNTRACESPTAYRGQYDSGNITSPSSYSMTWTCSTSVGDECIIVSSVAFTASIRIVDTMNVKDGINTVRTRIINTVDVIISGDIASVLKQIVISITDAIYLNETINNIRSRIISIVDTFSLSDAISNIRTRLLNIVDSLGIKDAISVGKLMCISVVDSMMQSDAVLFVRSIVISIADSISQNDAIQNIRSRIISIADALTQSDGLSIVARVRKGFAILKSKQQDRPKTLDDDSRL